MLVVYLYVFGKNFYSDPLPIFKSVCLLFFTLNCMNSLYILDINFLSVIFFANIFSSSVRGIFVLVIVSFTMQKSAFLFHVVLFIFAFISLA